jgi:RNA polymerase sigma-70 factor (sigma-E family)
MEVLTGVTARQEAPTDFAAYVGARGPALLRFAYLVTGDRVECADLVQEALERAWPRWDALVARGTHEAYVRRSIANGAISRWRKLNRLVPVAELASTETMPDGETTDSHVAWELCAQLPPVQQAAVVLRFYEDLSYTEIAAVLDCAESTARSHVYRALNTLRGHLTSGGDDV